ncbi:MAG: hypothetical protein SGILL_003130 [Bacillariaceae sp.]
MRRVSSRQRLVSWDAFDATANDESQVSDSEVNSVEEGDDGYHSAVELIPHCASDDLVGRKRDRSSMKADSAAKTPPTTTPPSTGAVLVAKNLSAPSSSFEAAGLLEPPTTSRLDVPTLIPSHSWEIDYEALNNSIIHDLKSSNTNNNMKHSPSTNTLSSFVSTHSTLPPLSPTSVKEIITFDKLMNDMHFSIFGFLDMESLQAVAALNSSFRELVVFSEDAQTSLWQRHCDNKWKIAAGTTSQENADYDGDADAAQLTYVDHLHLPTAVARPTRDAPNLPLLLKMTPAEYPTGVDEDMVEVQNVRTERLRPPPRQQEVLRRNGQSVDMPPAADGLAGYIRTYRCTETGRPLVRYTGPIGAGDRCIRSDHPLPRPKQEVPISATSSVTLGTGMNFFRTAANNATNNGSRQLLMNLWRRSSNRTNSGKKNCTSSCSSSSSAAASPWKPFVTPFLENSTTVNVTPRLISYYEVSILPFQENKNDYDSDGGDDDDIAGPPPAAETKRDCVAVGLATNAFHVHTRMPGWDRQSFGYHGDDGGLFHASGGMVKEFGSKFGEGDTIGCGIDYVNKGIFFTLNGRYLGYGWKGVEDEFLKSDLFPVVGLDSNCPLHFNFGVEEPFQFDLSKFIMKHESIIAPQYSLDTTRSPPVHVDSCTSLRSFSSCSSLASMASSSSATASKRSRRFGKRRGARERR